MSLRRLIASFSVSFSVLPICVGGWVGGWIEGELEAVDCFLLLLLLSLAYLSGWVGGWVGGWIEDELEAVDCFLLLLFLSLVIACGEEGRWVGVLRRWRRWEDRWVGGWTYVPAAPAFPATRDSQKLSTVMSSLLKWSTRGLSQERRERSSFTWFCLDLGLVGGLMDAFVSSILFS